MLIGFTAKNFAALEDFSLGLCLQENREEHLAPSLLNDQISRPVRPLTAFVGRNSTGKTAVFEALDFLSDCVRYDLPYAATIKRRSGFSSLRTIGSRNNISLTTYSLLPGYSTVFVWAVEIGADEYNRPHFVKESVQALSLSDIGLCAEDAAYFGLKTAEAKQVEPITFLELENGYGQIWNGQGLVSTGVSDTRRSGLAIFGSLIQYPELVQLMRYVRGWYYCRIGNVSANGINGGASTRAFNRQLSDGGGHHHLNEYGSNARNVLHYIKEENAKRYQDILRSIRRRMPGKGRISLKDVEQSIPTGELKLFLLLLLLADPAPRPLIMIDNPDSGLHYEMVEDLAQAMREYIVLGHPNLQLLFSSHNTLMLDRLVPEEIWIFRKDGDGSRSGSKANCVAESAAVRAMYEEGIGLGSLWYSGHFDSAGGGEGYYLDDENLDNDLDGGIEFV